MSRIGLALVAGLSLVGACASASPHSTSQLVFQTVGESRPAVRVFSDDSVTVILESEEFSFPNTQRTYPRWNGVRFRANANGRELNLDLRSDRPCAVEGVPRERTATVQVAVNGRAGEACGFFTASHGEDG